MVVLVKSLVGRVSGFTVADWDSERLACATAVKRLAWRVEAVGSLRRGGWHSSGSSGRISRNRHCWIYNFLFTQNYRSSLLPRIDFSGRPICLEDYI